MEKGTLQVLLVNARGIRRTNFLGKPSYYAVLQCGTEEIRSKTTKGYDHQAIWNQELEFEFPIWEWKKFKHLKINIMDENHFINGGFVGRAIIFLGGIINEGNDRGCIELRPSLYNVVLEDTTYKGQIKIGLKFRVNKEVREQNEEHRTGVIVGSRYDLYRSLWKFLRLSSWWRVVFPYDHI